MSNEFSLEQLEYICDAAEHSYHMDKCLRATDRKNYLLNAATAIRKLRCMIRNHPDNKRDDNGI